jgi:hypothetical protein
MLPASEDPMQSLLTLALLAAPTPALACGGFFCNRDEPVDQSGEKIVFAIDETAGKVEVHVQIAYQGEAEDFAWVLPAPTQPELFLSTERLFQVLEWSTAPNFQLNWVEEGECAKDFRIRAQGDTACWNCDYDAVADSGGPPSGGGVTVVARQRVGPYETLTLQATSSAELLTWLTERDFDLPAELAPALEPYLANDGYLVALRLAKDADTGDLAPLGMRYAGSVPVIPIQLTRIAATPDMRLQPYVLSVGRAVPDNYLHVVVNDAAIDWFSNGSNYLDVVTRAANEAGGQAFATDFAGTTDDFADLLYTPGQFDGVVTRLQNTISLDGFMLELGNAGFSGSSDLLSLLTGCLGMSPTLEGQGIQPADVFNCPICYLGEYTFNTATCATEIDERMIQPIIAADTLFDRFTWITRLTSSISPAEMTVDPIFVINPDMEAVPRTREADLVFECNKPDMSAIDAPRRLVFADGTMVPLPSSRWMQENATTYLEWVSEAAGFASRLVQDTSADAAPVLISDNSQQIGEALARLAAEAEVPVGGGTTKTGCGCDGGAGAGGLGLALLGLALGRRRRG